MNRHGGEVRDWIVAGVVASLTIAAVAMPRIAQDPAYHAMADQRALLGVPNFLNVISNLPFALVGFAGLIAAFEWTEAWERWPWVVLFAGTMLTTLGSGYYHLEPDNTRLVWDRVPMTFGFVGVLTAVLAERVSVALSRRLLFRLLALGVGSVAWWHWTEMQGAGDLRFYLMVQFGCLLVTALLVVLYPARHTGSAYLVTGLAGYAVAKVLETADMPIYRFGGIVSGHTLKHLVAAASIGCIVAMLRKRGSGLAPQQ